MTISRAAVGLPAALLLVVAAAAGETKAQEPGAPPESDTTELVFEREVFSYPEFARRNPFQPLLTPEAGGPRFEELRLQGIIHSPDPELSVALLMAGSPGEQAGGRNTYRVRAGDVLGAIRILEIQENRVVMEVQEFGITEQRVLTLPRPGEGGSS